MTELDPNEGLRAVVWIRDLSSLPEDPRRSVRSRLREFESTGVLEDVSVRVWGKSILAPEEEDLDDGHPIRERIAAFQRWADRNGHSLEPAFRRLERSTMISAERTAIIRLPVLCVALYDGDRLVRVYPCSTDGRTKTVAHCVERLETGELVTPSSTQSLE